MFFSNACSSSYVVSTSGEDTSREEFNESAEGEEAEIILLDSTEITATEVYLSADSLYWFNPETKLKTGVVKSEISKVMFTDTWLGGLEGTEIGLLSGGSAGILFGTIFVGSAEADQITEWYAAWIFGYGVAGALIGFPIGAIIGHTNEYEFQNNQQQENSDK